MSESIQIAIGSAVKGDGGFVGEVERVDVDPGGPFATAVSIRPRHEGGAPRRVPMALLEQGPNGLRLRCTRKEFEELPADGPVR
ncbi:hypothetical protein GCM10009839_89170 [Catenulispora yoronensis]|uniref:PRC-barrel domain-containing protein n=1 Tax=Catenulispora yoronensis TaxID=450799 RepID=A0ABN2VK31_9ACTN